MDENIYDDNSSDGVVLPEDENPFRNELKTSPNIKIGLSGAVTQLEPNRAKTRFFATSDMVADSEGSYTAGLFSLRLATRRWRRSMRLLA